MTPDGRFVEPPKPTLGIILWRLVLFGIGLCLIGALFWTAMVVLPVLLLMALIGYVVVRLQGSFFASRRWF